MAQHRLTSGGRYPVLRSIAILWLVGAALAFVGGIYQAVVALVYVPNHQLIQVGGGQWSGRIMAFFMWLAATFFIVLVNIAVAELIKLAIDLEHNTRLWSIDHSRQPVGTTVSGDSRASLEEESAEAALIRGH